MFVKVNNTIFQVFIVVTKSLHLGWCKALHYFYPFCCFRLSLHLIRFLIKSKKCEKRHSYILRFFGRVLSHLLIELGIELHVSERLYKALLNLEKVISDIILERTIAY